MSAIHVNVHTSGHVGERARATRERGGEVEVREHREAKPWQPAVPHHGDDDRVTAPVRDRDRDRDRDPDRDRHVMVETVAAPPIYTSGWTPSASYTVQPQPVTLLGATSLDSGQLAIDTAGQLGGVTTLQLESAGSGSTYVTQVVAYDANGTYQVTSVNAMLSPQNPTVQLALAGGADITKVVIDGHSDWGGAIAVQAS